MGIEGSAVVHNLESDSQRVVRVPGAENQGGLHALRQALCRLLICPVKHEEMESRVVVVQLNFVSGDARRAPSGHDVELKEIVQLVNALKLEIGLAVHEVKGQHDLFLVFHDVNELLVERLITAHFLLLHQVEEPSVLKHHVLC